MSATELMAQLQSDPDFQRRSAEDDARREEDGRSLREAESPIVAALQAHGVRVRSIWDLVGTSEPYPEALPVLIEHLERGGYPERVMEGLGRALAVKPAVAYWDRLKACWLRPRDAGEEEGVAAALAACATPMQVDDLIGFVSLETRGDSRVYFVRPLLAHGGQRGRKVVQALRKDPIVGREATALLRNPRLKA
ncbi:hypothetical protein [Nocardioides ultimimeridianus]